MRGEEGRGEESGWEEERRAREKKESFFKNSIRTHRALSSSFLSLSLSLP